MPTKSKCTGCKVFTLCLGDPLGLTKANLVGQCRYCRATYVGSLKLQYKDLCGEFHEACKNAPDGGNSACRDPDGTCQFVRDGGEITYE